MRGFALLWVLCVHAALALCILTSMQTLITATKITAQRQAKHRQFYALESAAYQLIKHTMDEPKLRLALDHSYRYQIQDLGIYPCMKITQDSQLKSSHQWMISVTSIQEPSSVLKLRIAWPENKTDSSCTLPVHRVITSGIMSWLYISKKVKKIDNMS